MRLRHIKGAEDSIKASHYVVQEPKNQRGRWAEQFGNDNPIEIEVGMGKGKFIMELAQAHPEINYIGIERYPASFKRAAKKSGTGIAKYLVSLCRCKRTAGSI